MNTFAGVEPKWVACGYCHAISLGAPPHGQGQACPMKMATEIAYVESLEASKAASDAAAASHSRSGFAMNDMTAMIRKMTGTEEDDE